MKICPYCGEKIKNEAIKCQYCKEFLVNESRTGIVESKTEKRNTNANKEDGLAKPQIEPKVPQIRPWIRYWARIIDICIFYIFSGIIIGIIYPEYFNQNAKTSEFAFGIIALFVYTFIEPMLISSFGYTPGKWLFNIKLRDQNGKRLMYPAALGRSFAVWFRGLGLGLPIISLITLLC